MKCGSGTLGYFFGDFMKMTLEEQREIINKQLSNFDTIIEKMVYLTWFSDDPDFDDDLIREIKEDIFKVSL